MQTQDTSRIPSGKKLLWSLIAAGLLLRLLTLGLPAITDPSEGRYAVMAQNMVLTGDWLTPRTYIEGQLVPFLGKPPLHAWATAASYTFFGVSEVSARLPSFLASSTVVILSAILAMQCFGVEAAIFSSLLLLSSWIFFFLGSSCLTDPMLMVFVSCSMFSFAKIFLAREPAPEEGRWPTKRFWQSMFFLSLSCGMMVKGPIAIAIPGLALFLWGISTKRIREMFSFPWALGALIFFAVVAPWYILAEIANPGFLKYFFINENLLRFFVKDYGDRYGSGHVYRYGTIWLMLFGGFVPGILMFAFRPVRKAAMTYFTGPKREEALFFLFWAFSPALIFTFSRQISHSYVLPGIPGLAVLCGAILRSAVESVETDRIVRVSSKVLTAFAAATVCLLVAGAVLTAGWVAVLLSLVGISLLVAAARTLRSKSADFRYLAVSAGLGAAVLFFSTAVINVAQVLGQKVSSKGVLEYAEQLAPKDNQTVGFLGLTPYSAYFYSREPDDKVSVVQISGEQLESTTVPVLVVHRKQRRDLTPRILLRFHEIAAIGDFTIYSANSPAQPAV